MIRFVFLFQLFAAAYFSAGAWAQDTWPRFRGPNGDGVAPDNAGLPTTWTTTNNVKWVADVPGQVTVNSSTTNARYQARPSSNHPGGVNAIMADGHSEWWAWKDARTIKLMEKGLWGSAGDNLGVLQKGNPDLVRVQKAIWGNELGYQPQ